MGRDQQITYTGKIFSHKYFTKQWLFLYPHLRKKMSQSCIKNGVRHNKRTLSYKYTNIEQDSHQTTTRPITSNPINLKKNNIKALQSI